MDTMTIESRYFILSPLTENGRRIIADHGIYWHVIEEKLRIPRLNRPGYVLQAEDGHFLMLRKRGSEHLKVEHEFFKEVEITLDYQEDIRGDDSTVSVQESSENRQQEEVYSQEKA